MQPGEVVGPGGKPEEPKQPVTEVQLPTPDAISPPPTPETQPPEPLTNWQFSAQDSAESAPVPATVQHDPVTWTASEYIAHDKTFGWYVVLGVSVLAFSAAVFILTRELVSSIVILVMGAAFGSFAARRPQELTYVLDNTALLVGSKPYSYAQFKSFAIVQEGGIHSITLMPLQRFMPPLSIYYDPSDEEKIVDAMSAYLPYEERKQDYVDRFMKKVKF